MTVIGGSKLAPSSELGFNARVSLKGGVLAMKRIFGVLALTTVAIFVGCGDDDDSDDGGATGGSAGKGGTGGKGGSGGSSAGKGGSGGTAGKGGSSGDAGHAGELGEGGTPTGTGGGGAGPGPSYDYEAACIPGCEANADCVEGTGGQGGGAGAGAVAEPYDMETCLAECEGLAEGDCEAEYQELLDCKDEDATYECAGDGFANAPDCEDELLSWGTCLAG
jgi:hypothetical protein